MPWPAILSIGAVAERDEFQQTFSLLKAFRDLQAASGTSALPLPPPPR